MENHGSNGGGKVAASGGDGERRGRGRSGDLVLRGSAMVMTLVAAIVLGVDKQTKIVPMQLVSSLPPLNIPVHAKWHYLSAFVYFVVINSIACAYAALSLVLTVATKGAKKNMSLIIMVLDLIMVALLFSSVGAAGAVGVLGMKGNPHVRWNKVCNVFDKFCHQGVVAMVFSFLGSLAYLFLVVLAANSLHKKYK